MPSKEELLASVQPDMRLTWDFFKRIYGYEISFPGFADEAIALLEAAGCSKARRYYEGWVNEYEIAHNAELKDIAAWYRMECEKEWKEGEEKRKQWKKGSLQQMSSKDLIALLENLTGVS